VGAVAAGDNSIVESADANGGWHRIPPPIAHAIANLDTRFDLLLLTLHATYDNAVHWKGGEKRLQGGSGR
jgi:hypothetical protein